MSSYCCSIFHLENAVKKTENEKKNSSFKSSLNSPVKKSISKKPLDPATLTKARSLSLDSIKNKFGKKIKDRNLSLSSGVKLQTDDSGGNPEGSNLPSVNESAGETKKIEHSKVKRRDSNDKNSLSGLLTFDHVPASSSTLTSKKEERPSPRKSSSERRESVEDNEKKRKDSQSKSKVRCF